MSLTGKVQQFIAQHGLLPKGAQVIVGLSGGADSTALLLILLRLGYKCTAVHCNFHLRGAESDRDQQFVETLCHGLGVELITCSYDTRSYASRKGISIEMAARELRYADFERILNERGGHAICIAHHRDDSVETLLLNLIRGTGLRGLTGIKPINGNIVRPLLCVSRAEIEQWLNENHQPYVTDSTNLETDYTRNKIRLELLPLMRRINPSADSSIDSTALHLQQAYAFYNKAIEQTIKEVVNKDGDYLSIDISKLSQAPSVQGLLFEILSPLGFNDAQISLISASLNAQPGTRFCSGTHQVIKDRDCFTVSKIAGDDFKPITVGIEPGTAIPLPHGRMLAVTTAPSGTPIAKEASVVTFDAGLIDGPLLIREWKEGDWFIPFGMKGRKLVSDFLTDCKISAASRKSQLVVTHRNDIIWVVGLRSDNRYRIDKNTAQQLILTVK